MSAGDYGAFLAAKMPSAPKAGLACAWDDIATHRITGEPVKDHQRAVIKWGVEGGRRAWFLNFGLGKSSVQVEAGRIILEKVAIEAGDRNNNAGEIIGLIVGPLGARSDIIADAAKLGVRLVFVRSMADIAAETAKPDGARLFLTNFDTVRDGKLDVSAFTYASIDEAAALRDYGSETFQTFMPLFVDVPYRFVATAMPAPNRYKELIHYAAFLGIMDSGQALTRFFQRNSEKAGDLTLYPHKEDEFWLWVHSWAVFLQKPSDLGFSDDGYELPELIVREHCVTTDLSEAGAESNGQGRLMRDAALGVVEASREARTTIDVRVAKVKEIVEAAPKDHFIIWHDLEDERRAIEKALPDVNSVFGSQKLERNEEVADSFARGEIARLAAKPSMLGAGRNFQHHCHRATIFPTYKFHDFLQALHRIYRFMQQRAVEIDLIYAETQTEQLRALMVKWDNHKAMVERMSDIIRRYGLNHDAAAENISRSIGCDRQEQSGASWRLANNDCVEEAKRLDEGSLDLIVTSIPFSNHYEYTPSYNDFGHTDNDDHFFEQMDFLTPALFRALSPGRLACIHVKDRILFGAVTGQGVPTVNPFHAKCIFHYLKHGFQFMGMRHVDTDVVRENNQTYRLSYSEMLKDATKMGCGSPEYILLFRRPQTDRSRGYADNPVTKDPMEYSLARWQIDAHAHWRSRGDRLLTLGELADMADEIDRFAGMPVGSLVKAFREQSRHMVYDYEAHVAIGEKIEAREKNDQRGHLPRTFMALAPGSTDPAIWDDIVRMRTLNAEQVQKGREKHVCPLQFDIVDRLIDFFSMPGELVYDPFCGLGTVPLRAIKKGRRGMGSELNPDYWRHSVLYLQQAERELAVPTLFDLFTKAAE